MSDNQVSRIASQTREREKAAVLSKSHIAYWRERLIKPLNSANWCVEIAHRGERHRLTLGTPNQELAAREARDIYEAVRANGWEVTLQRLRPAMAKKKVDLSVGQYIAEVLEVIPVSKTVLGYTSALRKVAADVAGIDGGKSKHDYRAGGCDAWRQRVDAVKLSSLTPEAIQKWKVSILKKAGSDESAKDSARTSINSYIRCARSLFQDDITQFLTSLELPSPLPFKGVKPEPQPSSRYFGDFDLGELITKACAELATEHPEQFQILLLCGLAGLRRHEADLLEWNSLRWDDGVIRVRTTRHFAGKTKDSIADIVVDRELLEYFRGMRPKGTSSFVLESGEPKSVHYAYYRAAAHFEGLVDWLRKQGLTSKKPLHELRKMFGNEINKKFGIHSASIALRHSSLAITASTYVDSRSRVSVGMRHLLAGESDKVTPITAATPNNSEQARQAN
jgi:integrase